MSEQPFFFARGTTQLFGLLHEPTAGASTLGFVMSHPFAEEKLWSHRVFVSAARALAARGHAVLRFDYTGAGDSDGSTCDTSLASHLDDLKTAIETLSARRPELTRIGIAGLRFGATLAALVAEQAAEDPHLAKVRDAPLMLWDPVLDGAAYLQDVLRANLSNQLATYGKVIETREVLVQRILGGGIVNVDGYEIGRGLFESVAKEALLPATTKRHRGPVFVAPIAPPRKAKPLPAVDALVASYARAEQHAVEEQPFWREIKQFYGHAPQLQAASLDWLERADG